MGKIFNLENPVWQFIGRLVDVVVLHVIWFVISCGIVTMGPATAALYYALMKDISEENGHYIKMFFKSFKENFKQGMVLGLLFLISGVLIAFAMYFYYKNMSSVKYMQVLFGLSIAMAVIWAFTFTYIFPLLARFGNTTLNLLKNALLMSIRHIGWTLLMVVWFAAVYLIAFGLGFLPILIFGYGAVALLNSYVLNHVFKPYIEAAGGGRSDDDPDHWEISEEEMSKAVLDEDGNVIEKPADDTALPEETAETEEAAEETSEKTAEEISENNDAEASENE